MSSDAQIAANRENAQSSTGPRTDEGRIKSSTNALKLGLFTTNNCIFPGEEDEYAHFRDALWSELRASGPLQEVHAAEIVRAAWRLRRCAMAEERLGWRCEVRQDRLNRENNTELPPADPSISDHTIKEQAAVDRARAQAQNSLRRAQAALEKLQNEANRSMAASQTAPLGNLQSEKLRNEPKPAIEQPQTDSALTRSAVVGDAKLQNEANPLDVEPSKLQNEAEMALLSTPPATKDASPAVDEPNLTLARAA